MSFVRNLKIKSLIHFNNYYSLPKTDDMQTLDKIHYQLKDEVPENKIQTMGTHLKCSFTNMYITDRIGDMAYYFNTDKKVGYTLAVTKQYSSARGEFYYTDYPIIFGGQDFTIEITIFFYNMGPIFSFSPFNYVLDKKDGIYTVKEFTIPDKDKIKSSDYNKITKNAFGMTYYGQNGFRLKVPGKNELKGFITLLRKDITNYTNMQLQIILVYYHKKKVLNVYINGYKTKYSGGPDVDLLDNIDIPRLGYLTTFIGAYYINGVTFFPSSYTISFDEFRLCDGRALYDDTDKLTFSNNSDHIPYDLVINRCKDDEYLPKLICHFINPIDNIKALSNEITAPTLVESEPENKGFDYEIKFNGDHQYLELMRATNIEPEATVIPDNVKKELPNISTAHDAQNWESGIDLGGKNFTIESFLIINPSTGKRKCKRTIFEFNRYGCTKVKHYFRLIIDYTSNLIETEEYYKIKMIVEQSNITNSGYKELVSFYVPYKRKFHWFICYHYNTKKLKVYIDENEMDENYITRYPDAVNSTPRDKYNEGITANIHKYEADSVDFNRVNFQQFLLATNVAPIEDDNESYPYANSFIGTMEEFRLLDDVAAEPYTPEKPYTIFDETPEWDDPVDYGPEEILNITYDSVYKYKPREILDITYNSIHKYGPKEILNITYDSVYKYKPREILDITYNSIHKYGPKEILNIEYGSINKYGPKEILNITYDSIHKYGPKEILNITYNAVYKYKPRKILDIIYDSVYKYGPKEILNITYDSIHKYGPKEILDITYNSVYEYEPRKILDIIYDSVYKYGPKEILNIDFIHRANLNIDNLLNIKYSVYPHFDDDILDIEYINKRTLEPEEILNIEYRTKVPFSVDNLLNIEYGIPIEFPLTEILNIDYVIPTEFPLTDILNIEYGVPTEFPLTDILNIEYINKAPFSLENMLNIEYGIRGTYEVDNLLNIEYVIGTRFPLTEILNIEYAAKEMYGPMDILNIEYNAYRKPLSYGPKRFFTISYTIEEDYGPVNIMNIDYIVPPPPGEYGPNDILNISYKNVINLRNPGVKFDTLRKIPDNEDYLLIAVSFT